MVYFLEGVIINVPFVRAIQGAEKDSHITPSLHRQISSASHWLSLARSLLAEGTGRWFP